MVLFVFVVMLLNLRAEETLRAGTALQRWSALALGVVFAGVLFWAIQNRADRPFFQPETFKQGFGTARDLGTGRAQDVRITASSGPCHTWW